MTMKCVIPARGGSKSIPRKNLAPVLSMPLIYFSIVIGRKVFGEVYVSTDDSDIKEISLALGARVIDRPKEFGTDDATDLGWINHAFGVLDCDEICILRPTTPIREAKVIEEALKLYEMAGSTGLRSVHELPESPLKCFYADGLYMIPFATDVAKYNFNQCTRINGVFDVPNLPKQIFKPIYKPNGYVDIVSKETTKNGSIYGELILAYKTPVSVEIDSIEELQYINYLMSKK